MPVVQVLGRLREESKASLPYTVSSRLARTTQQSLSKQYKARVLASHCISGIKYPDRPGRDNTPFYL